MNEIDKRQLIKDVDTVADVEITKRLKYAINVARATDFYNKLKDIVNRKNKLSELQEETLKKIIERIDIYSTDYLRKKLRQWNDTARKMKEDAAKNRIAR